MVHAFTSGGQRDVVRFPFAEPTASRLLVRTVSLIALGCTHHYWPWPQCVLDQGLNPNTPSLSDLKSSKRTR